MSLDAAQRVYNESIAKLRAGEVIRVRDAAGALVLSTDPTELLDIKTGLSFFPEPAISSVYSPCRACISQILLERF